MTDLGAFHDRQLSTIETEVNSMDRWSYSSLIQRNPQKRFIMLDNISFLNVEVKEYSSAKQYA